MHPPTQKETKATTRKTAFTASLRFEITSTTVIPNCLKALWHFETASVSGGCGQHPDSRMLLHMVLMGDSDSSLSYQYTLCPSQFQASHFQIVLGVRRPSWNSASESVPGRRA